MLLEPITVPGHLRDGLQRGTAPQPTADKLRKASQRFDGRDTVCLLEEPVRAGIDDVTIIENTGVLIIGWLFDPERRVDAVTLRSGGQSCAVDRLWTRVQRPDVTAAFLEDPRFGALASRRNSHGFIVFAPKLEPEPGQPLHLAFEIQGTARLLPLEPGRGQARRTLERVFGLLDPPLYHDDGEHRGRAPDHTGAAGGRDRPAAPRRYLRRRGFRPGGAVRPRDRPRSSPTASSRPCSRCWPWTPR
ncbi:hypothetical protein BTHI11S_05983 [Bosea thiooxidans]